jgi:hypothetical protein
MARPAGDLWVPYYLLQSLRSPAAGHDAAVQLIDTFVVRTHQHVSTQVRIDHGHTVGEGTRCE